MSKIFVSIACFMDKDIINTINDCLLKAKYPNNLTLGICLQYDPDDDFLKMYDNNPQFKIIKMNWKEAKGPTYARYLITKLIKDEEYFLQIDCHSRFFNHWDKIAIDCLNECNDNKAILTAFPASIDNMNNPSKCLMNKSTNIFQHLSLESIKLGSVVCNSKKIENTYYLSAACLFGPSRFIKEVLYDPILTYAYQSIEQQFYAIRLFTFGWNLYMPPEHFVATYYKKMDHFNSNGKRIYAPSNVNRGKQSWDRVLFYYGLKNINELDDCVKKNILDYGLGKERTIDRFFEIHKEKHCIKKLKEGNIYDNKTHRWNIYYYYCNNSIFNSLMNIRSDFIKTTNENEADFFYNIKPTHTNYKLQFYPMKNVSFIDNKKDCYLLFDKYKLTRGIPKTYFDVNQLNNLNRNVFLKYAGYNGGDKVFMFNNISDIKKNINENKIPGQFIIQEEVKNILLINEKKFILRIWIVVIDNQYFISTNGCCIIHEKKYDENCLDRNIHIDHDLQKITYQEYNKTNFYKQSFQKIILLSENICNILNTKHQQLNNCFQILGLDFIIDKKMDPYLIEINAWPCLYVPYENYKLILEEFFSNFLTSILVPKLQKTRIVDTSYFKKLNMNATLYNVIENPTIFEKYRDPKILILILSSDGVYEEMSKLSENTWLNHIDKYKNIQCKFYYGKNKIFTSHDEIRSKILNKTIDVFKYVDNNYDYDYVLRLCACSYVDLNKLNNFAKTVGNTRIFSGPFNNTSSGADKRYNLKQEPFITGANLFLSNDVVKYLIENEHLLDYEKYGPADDLNISMVINKNYIHKDNWLNQNWIKLNDSSKIYCEKMKNNKNYHYHYDHREFKDQLLEFHKNYQSFSI